MSENSHILTEISACGHNHNNNNDNNNDNNNNHNNNNNDGAQGDSSVVRLLYVFLVERFAVRISPLAFFADAPYMCGSQKTLWQDYTGCSFAFLTVVSVEVFRHQAIVGELVTVQGIECSALTSLTYLTWPVC